MTDQALTTTTERPRTAITAGGNVGALIPQDIEQAFRIAQALAHSGMTPQGFKTPETCFVAIMAGAELGLPPFQSLQSFAIINNRPTLWGDALVAVIRTNGFKMREWLEGEGDDMEAFCEVIRPDNGDVAEASFSVEDAKTARLWGKAGPWQSNPKRMLKMRARAFAIRDGAADVLRGFQIREEVEDYDAAPMPTETKAQGTGLLAKLQSNETLATEGFGVRNVAEEAGEAAPEAQPKPKPRGRPKKAQTALDAIAEAEPEIVAQAVEDHGTTDAEEAAFEEARQDAAETGTYQDAPETPADAQVEEAAPADPEPVLMASPDTIADGHAEPGEAYFIADQPAFPSGRRVAFVNGVSQKDTVEAGTLPVYAEHAPEVAAEDPFAIFDRHMVTVKNWKDLRPALVELSRSPEWAANPDKVRAVRCEVWGLVDTWNEGGAALDPIDDPFMFQAYVTATTDIEAIEGTYAMVQDQDWFKAANEAMQAGVGRFVMKRVAEIRGA